jgi:hypothetical protein
MHREPKDNGFEYIGRELDASIEWLGIFIWGYQNLPPEHTTHITFKLRARELATIDIITDNRE